MEAVLKGAPILPVSSETAASHMGPPLKGCDIRHVSKNQGSAASALRKIKTRRRFKRAAAAATKTKPKEEPSVIEFGFDDPTRMVAEPRGLKLEVENWGGRESELSQRSDKDCGSDDAAECLSVETVDASSVGQGDVVELELTLGLGYSRMLT